MGAIEPPAYRASARKRADLTRAVESGGLRVVLATALPRAGERAPFESQNALGPPHNAGWGTPGRAPGGDRAATGGQVGTGQRPAPLVAKGVLQDVQAVSVSCPTPPPRQAHRLLETNLPRRHGGPDRAATSGRQGHSNGDAPCASTRRLAQKDGGRHGGRSGP
jgi:hypothetical protein